MPRQSRSTALCALLVLCVRAYKPDRSPIAPVAGRRAALQWLGTAAVATGAGALVGHAPPALAADEVVPVYFGQGCFWHVQHEFVEYERALLNRDGAELSARAGYAGGKALDQNRVCYHNLRSVADYGKLGHTEVVGLQVPAGRVGDFADKYFDLFVKYENVPGFGTLLERNDPGDRGGEYRSAIGIPGGTKSPLFSRVEEANAGRFKLVAGLGNEPDTFTKNTVYVYDTKDFPFHTAEIYHQFHNDFKGPRYPAAYNALKDKMVENGQLTETGCPEGFAA